MDRLLSKGICQLDGSQTSVAAMEIHGEDGVVNKRGQINTWGHAQDDQAPTSLPVERAGRLATLLTRKPGEVRV